ncbi:hypothetical protein SAMN04490248_12316 [Salinihabitans flavidus]|uniref:Uncharacterized protein n=1 Tax=Salinihabitans flavidus TaxID=569882 RepID=A0A1H8UXU6_9RHOB|nr:hypothetical protein SAMN04490248_12316 [Salinihabitans flavidus]
MAARDPAIIISVREQFPSLMLLAGDIGLAGLSLRIERIEVLFQPLFGAFAGIKMRIFGLGALVMAKLVLRPWRALRRQLRVLRGGLLVHF